MSMVQCSECGQQISSSAVTCPNCGRPRGHAAFAPEVVVVDQTSDDGGSGFFSVIVGLAGGVLFFAALLFLFGSSTSSTTGKNINVKIDKVEEPSEPHREVPTQRSGSNSK